jgi:hypothetical protein
VECCIPKDGGGVQECGPSKSPLVGCTKHLGMKIQAICTQYNTVNIFYSE